jgi:hypothetical protein
MTSIPQSKKAYCSLIFFIMIGIFSSTGFAKPIKPGPTHLLTTLKPSEPWDKGILTAAKTVSFNQTASGGTDATTISKITLSYFTSADCTGSVAGSGSYTTPNGTSFTTSLGTVFGLVATSTWNVGSTQLSIADMTTIDSVAVTFKSTNNSTPQAAFDGSGNVISYACVPVTCTAGPGGTCTETGSGTLDFTLKTTAAVGDPADGGVIGCQNTGATGHDVYDLVVAITNQSNGQVWGGSGTITGATSFTDGATNTATIVAALGTGSTYAARTCNELTQTGGFTSGWFLASGEAASSEFVCLYENRTAIGVGTVAAGGTAFNNTNYWSSTEEDSTRAFRQVFNGGGRDAVGKISSYDVRCVRAY